MTCLEACCETHRLILRLWNLPSISKKDPWLKIWRIFARQFQRTFLECWLPRAASPNSCYVHKMSAVMGEANYKHHEKEALFCCSLCFQGYMRLREYYVELILFVFWLPERSIFKCKIKPQLSARHSTNIIGYIMGAYRMCVWVCICDVSIQGDHVVWWQQRQLRSSAGQDLT